MRMHSLKNDESGIALITALLVVMLISGLLAGMIAALNSDQRSHAVDRDQSQAYAAAHAGLEKLTAGMATLFATDFSPSAAQVDIVDNNPPALTGFQFTAPGGAVGSGYAVSFTPDPGPGPNTGNPLSFPNADITTGPFTGFKGLITPYTLTVTARSTSGSEVRLRREVQTVAVPVFQFGIFGEKSLSFHAGADFDFGGRVHTNQHLFLASGDSATLTFRDKLTAVGEVVRSQLENTTPITASGHDGTVTVPTVIGSTYRDLESSEGSVGGGPGSTAYSGWKNLSEVTYNTNIRTTLTGAKRLDLPLTSQGAVPIDLIRRPVVGSNEAVANSPVYLQRYFAQASLRILLSDRAADLTGLPTITGGAPLQLDGNWNAGGAPPVGYVVGAGRPPLSRAIGAGLTTTAAGSTYANPFHQILVDAVTSVPAALRIPAGGITIGGQVGVQCTGKTASSFTGCTLAANVAAGQNVTVTLNSGNTVTTQTAGATVNAGANRTVTVVANGALPFSHDLSWITTDAAGTIRPMSCQGYTTVAPATLINCRVLGITAALGTAGRTISTYSLFPAGTSQLSGFIKIEKQNAAGVWSDVTVELLNLGFAAPNQEGAACGDPTPNAVIRFQRLRDNGGVCNYANSTDSYDYWPNALYDAREGTARDLATTAPMTMGGLMNYVTLDVGNLKRWLSGAIGATGNTALNNNGFIVYFSDRRGNHNDAVGGAPETGEYGYEDSINQGAGIASSAPNGVNETGEDRNESGAIENYAAVASTVLGVVPAGAPVGAVPFGTTTTPLTNVTNRPEARINRQVLFRRALKLANGCIGAVAGCTAAAGVNNLPDSGLTVATENGAYVQGDYNATSTDVTAEPNRPASIIADALTILSNSWVDVASLNSPNDMAARDATETGYRFALVAGKSIAFPKPNWTAVGDWGTDGGVHNFMRMLENWGGQTINYRGSIVSLYTARQNIGIYRANSNIYSPGTRAFAFDTDFLTPALLPPGTPMFRDINTLKFRQVLRPNQ